MGNKKQSWKIEGFEAFARGSFGNSGQNLYVSRAGILQRIYQYDLTGNGYVDLVFCNSQSHFEKPDSLVYSDLLGNCHCRGIRTHGCRAATVADLNGDGYDDLVLGHIKDGLATDLNAFIYYGSPQGLTENYHTEIPAPGCTAVAAGDFNGDGRIDLAFITRGKLRIFYQTELGFELKKFTDFDIQGQQLDAYDLDEDGFFELLIRSTDGTVTIYWGGTDGFQESRKTEIPASIMNSFVNEEESVDDGADVSDEEFVADADPLLKVIGLAGKPHVFCPFAQTVLLIPVDAERSFGTPLEFRVRKAYSVAAGDVNGNGFTDLVFASRDKCDGTECSWIYWCGEEGYSELRREHLPSSRAADVAVADLNGNGFSDILIVQNRDAESFTTESLIYPGNMNGLSFKPVRLVSHDARRGFIARTSDEELPQVILTSNFARSASDDLKSCIYFGSKEGYSAENKKEIPSWGAFSMLYADLNDDGLADLVFANGSEFSALKDPGSYLYYNSNDGIGDRPDQVLPTSAGTVAVCADLDRNGYLDLVMCGFRSPEVLIFPGGLNGFQVDDKITIPLEHGGKPYGFLFSLFLVDLTGDGWLDMIVGGGVADMALILWGRPEGFSVARSRALATYMPRTITAADLSGNGYPDLIIGGRNPQLTGPHDAFLYVYWNGPEGLREDRRTMLPVKSTNGLAVADFNNDGSLDIFAGSYADGRERDLESYIYWNRPGHGFTLLDRLCLQTHAVGGCLAADFNENGWVDLAVANHKVLGDHKGYSEIWWNGPDGFNVSRTAQLPTLGARGPSINHPGNILDRGAEEYYVSEPFSLPADSFVEGITWKAKIPQKTWVKAQLRVANDAGELERLPWLGQNGANSWWEKDGSDSGIELSGRCVQFRLALGAINSCSSPRISSVSVNYRVK